jgi:hypothetical protein
MSEHTTTINEDLRIVVTYDEGADDPRDWTPECDVLQYNVPWRGSADDLGDCRTQLGTVFTIVYGNTGDDAKALAVALRYKRFFDVKEDIETSTITGYSQGDWADVVAVVPEGYGTPADHIKVFRQWKFGDVYVVGIERRVSYVRAEEGGSVDRSDEHSHWELIDSLGGVYFDDDFPDDEAVIEKAREIHLDGATDTELEALGIKATA